MKLTYCFINISKSASMKTLTGKLNLKELPKTIPKNMPYDKEKLYEELIKSKSIVNFLTNENFQLHTQIQTLNVPTQNTFFL